MHYLENIESLGKIKSRVTRSIGRIVARKSSLNSTTSLFTLLMTLSFCTLVPFLTSYIMLSIHAKNNPCWWYLNCAWIDIKFSIDYLRSQTARSTSDNDSSTISFSISSFDWCIVEYELYVHWVCIQSFKCHSDVWLNRWWKWVEPLHFMIHCRFYIRGFIKI